jgi:uncharacterized protein YjgD (DUF1641 family)
MYGNGVAVLSAEERLRQRLNEPGTAELLLQILDKLDVVHLAVSSLDGFLQRSDTIIENVASSVRDVRDNVPASPVDTQKAIATLSAAMPQLLEALPRITAALPELLSLSDQLRNPQTAVALQTILSKMDVLALTVASLDAFLQRSDTIIENIASSVRGVRETAPVGDLDLISGAIEALPQMAATLPTITDRLPQLITVADQLQGLLNSAEVTALMGSGIFSPQTVAVVAHAGDALVESYNANQTAPKQVGLFGLLRALGDPDVQRGLGFLVDFGKRFGQQLENHHS